MGEDEIVIGQKRKKYNIRQLLNGIEKEEQRMKKKDSNIIIGKIEGSNVSIGDNNMIISRDLDEKINILIKELITHNIEGKEDFVKKLEDNVIKSDKTQLRQVMGNVISKAAQVGSIISAATAILALL